MNIMARTFGFGVVIGVCVAFSAFGGSEAWGRIEHIIMKCRHKGDSLLADDLLAYAKKQGMSDEEMSARLVELARAALDEQADWEQRQLARGALWGLISFGGQKEATFVLEIARKTADEVLRLAAIRVGIRIDAVHWEEWVREVCHEVRFSSLDCFAVCEEAYRIGKNGDERTRKRVETVLSEYAGSDVSKGNQERLRRWAAELKSAETAGH